jgi:hypothetical protein
MEFQQFVNLVAELRQTQREYFATRSYASLKKSKQLEKRVDESISIIRNELLNTQATQLELGFSFD